MFWGEKGGVFIVRK